MDLDFVRWRDGEPFDDWLQRAGEHDRAAAGGDDFGEWRLGDVHGDAAGDYLHQQSVAEQRIGGKYWRVRFDFDDDAEWLFLDGGGQR